MTIQEMQENMEQQKKNRILSDIEFFHKEAKRLGECIKRYPKLPLDKQLRYEKPYKNTIALRQAIILKLNHIIETYERQQQAEEYFSKVK